MTKPLFLARLAGSQAEMGAQHGALAATDAARLFDFYRAMPETVLAGGMGKVETFAIRSLATAWQRSLAKRRPRELAERTRAFAEAVAAQVPGHHVTDAQRTMATMDSLQNCVSLIARGRIGPFGASAAAARATTAAIPACSTVIAWGDATADGELLFARNFDFPGIGVWDAAPSFVVCAPDRGQRYGFFAARGADAPAVTVVNEAGLVFAPHTRWHKDVTWSGAMIVDVVHEMARRAETLADAIAIAREYLPISSSWGVAIGSSRERTAAVLEIAGPHLEVVRPTSSYLVCNNHYRSAALQRGEFRASHAWDVHSVRRERRLRELLDTRTQPVTAHDLARFLGDRVEAGCERQLGGIVGQAINVHAVVVAPTRCEAHLGVDRAPACDGTWAHVTWTWDGPRGGWELGAVPADTGFTATELTAFTRARTPVTDHVHAAAVAYEHAHDVVAARAALERAIVIAPEDPSLRLAAAWLALEDGAADRAVIHVRAALAHETDTYRTGQLLLWGVRAAQRTDAVQSARWREQLEALRGDGIDELRARLRARAPRKPGVNLMMVDAY